MEKEFRAFIDQHVRIIEPLSREMNLSFWEASISGRKKDYERTAALELELRQIYSNRKDFEKIQSFKQSKDIRDPLLLRQLDILFNAYLENQIDDDLTKKIVSLSNEIENIFNTFRAELEGKPTTNNRILDILRYSTDSNMRQKAWDASKQVGPVVVDKLLHLVKLRNQAARQLGFENYYIMSMTLSEQDPAAIEALFQDLADRTNAPFQELKREIDNTLAVRYGISVAEIKPWHYEDPFFQEAPHIFKTNFSQFFKDRDVVDLAREFYSSIHLSADPILKNSDLYERPGKDQHAFCIDIDRKGDVRVLANVKNDEYWMSTMLHELGHGVYDYYIDRELPFLLRTHAHIFATEAVAMFFGRLLHNADWLEKMVDIPKHLRQPIQKEARKTLRLQQLVFSRWAQVMVHFERELYRNPDQDLNSLWWQLVEKYQFVRKPEGRDAPDWATKVHMCSAPVYYHNYQLGELMASQIHHFLLTQVLNLPADQQVGFVEMAEVGTYFREKIFSVGARYHWDELLKFATGESLTPKYFVRQFV
ncbi:MAG: peptidase M3 [Calditrichaeota bacterium]|nr:peptidase M3 [Calditrichota bacterium]